jgi:hypothetical protein
MGQMAGVQVANKISEWHGFPEYRQNNEAEWFS